MISFVSLAGCQEEPVDGKNSLMEINAEPAGENCQSGGFKISTGLDLNENSLLEENEVQYEEYLCNGSNGQNGTNGENGQNGTNGEDGQSEGSISMVRIPFTLAYKWRTCETVWTSEVEDGLLYNFNIDAYQGFDSAIFVSQFFRGLYDDDKIWLRLYDYTSHGDIGGSELYSDTPDPGITDPDLLIHRSGNFISSFMPGPRTIGIQFRREVEEYRSISIHHAELILYN